MADNIQLRNKSEAQSYANIVLGLEIAIIEMADPASLKSKELHQILIDDPEFREDLKGFLEIRSEGFYDFLKQKYPRRSFVSKAQLLKDDALGNYLKKLHKEYEKVKEYQESRPDLYD